MTLLTQALTAQASRERVSSTNTKRGMGSYRIRDFIGMNALEFYGSKVEEDANGLIDGF